MGVLVEELVDGVDVPESLVLVSMRFERDKWVSYVELLVRLVLLDALGVERWASVAGDQVASETSEALREILVIVEVDVGLSTHVGLEITLSKAELLAVGCSTVGSDPILDVLVHVH